MTEALNWDTEHPNLYEMRVEWKGDDSTRDNMTRRFGFRWFDVQDVNGDKQFTLNGKGYFFFRLFPGAFGQGNGIYPTEEMAERQIYAAKNFGLNMLNFHRCIGQSHLL